MNYGFIKKVDLNFSSAVLKVEEELRKQGFSILTRIDVQDKFQEKLKIDFPKYQILGACNAQLAYQAIKTEWNIGLLLPCNVIVYEKNKGVWIGIIKPSQAMAMIDNDELRKHARKVEDKLEQVFENI